MSKQTLSVSDFAWILNMVNEKVDRMERREEAWTYNRSDREIKKEQEKMDKEREERLKSSYYLQLKHLQNSLMNLNIEVETPDVELTNQHENEENR